MSRLSEILGVKEEQKFQFGDDITVYRINKDRRQYLIQVGFSNCWTDGICESSLSEMIAHPELIHPIPEKPQLSEQQITAIKGRIAEGTPWAARDKDSDNTIYFFPNKPRTNSAKISWHVIEMKDLVFVTVGSNKNNFYDFITYDNSPVYLPELVGESEK